MASEDDGGDLGQRPAPRGLRGAHRDVSTLRLRRRDGVPWIRSMWPITAAMSGKIYGKKWENSMENLEKMGKFYGKSGKNGKILRKIWKTMGKF